MDRRVAFRSVACGLAGLLAGLSMNFLLAQDSGAVLIWELAWLPIGGALLAGFLAATAVSPSDSAAGGRRTWRDRLPLAAFFGSPVLALLIAWTFRLVGHRYAAPADAEVIACLTFVLNALAAGVGSAVGALYLPGPDCRGGPPLWGRVNNAINGGILGAVAYGLAYLTVQALSGYPGFR